MGVPHLRHGQSNEPHALRILHGQERIRRAGIAGLSEPGRRIRSSRNRKTGLLTLSAERAQRSTSDDPESWFARAGETYRGGPVAPAASQSADRDSNSTPSSSLLSAGESGSRRQVSLDHHSLLVQWLGR